MILQQVEKLKVFHLNLMDPSTFGTSLEHYQERVLSLQKVVKQDVNQDVNQDVRSIVKNSNDHI